MAQTENDFGYVDVVVLIPVQPKATVMPRKRIVTHAI